MLDTRDVVPARRRALVVPSEMPAPVCVWCHRKGPSAGSICLRCFGKLLRDGGMDGLTWAARVVDYMDAMDVRTGRGARNDLGHMSEVALAAELGVTPRHLSRALYVIRGVEDFPHLATELRGLSQGACIQRVKQARREEAAERNRALATQGDPFHLVLAECCGLLKSLEPRSVDVILTDPPYQHSATVLYGGLAEDAARVLKPTGMLVVMVPKDGPEYLDRMNAMAAHIPYRTQLAYWYDRPGRGTHRQSRVGGAFKVIAVFGSSARYLHGDVIVSKGTDHRYHPHGQDVGGFVQLVEKLSNPGDTIVDPFCGGGSTGVAVLTVGGGRTFIGGDMNPDHVATTYFRLRDGQEVAA